MPQPNAPTSNFTASYDAWNRLKSISTGATTVATFSYDCAKRRVNQNSYTAGVLSETRHIYYTEPSRWQPIEERTGTSTTADRQFVWGLRYVDDLIERDRGSERLYSMQDANWNVTAVSDASAAVQERYAYSAYGTPTILSAAFVSRSGSSVNWETLYAGYRYDVGTAFYHVRHRPYHPSLGTWAARDPLGYSDSNNLYLYCLARPTTALDPSGLLVPVVVVGVIVVTILFSPNPVGAPASGDHVPPYSGDAGFVGGLVAGSLLACGPSALLRLRGAGCLPGVPPFVPPALINPSILRTPVCQALGLCACTLSSTQDPAVDECLCCKLVLDDGMDGHYDVSDCSLVSPSSACESKNLHGETGLFMQEYYLCLKPNPPRRIFSGDLHNFLPKG